ncbi:hypothetical protein [Sorangium cellulosum]|uniref:hypothetical protein n=1 Tax=Sorangium cellulosum TaxID=56 RepID=UPI000CF37DD1|nr:hypothetical protein [Sorangium cellulosum]
MLGLDLIDAELVLLDALGYDERSVFYEVGVATRSSPVDRCTPHALRLTDGDFHDLRQLTLEHRRGPSTRLAQAVSQKSRMTRADAVLAPCS